MGDLFDLFRSQQPVPGFGQTLSAAGSSPFSSLKGLLWNNAVGALRGLKDNVLNAAQSISPIAVPGATDPYYGGDLGKRAFGLVNSVGPLVTLGLMGSPQQLADRLDQDNAEHGQPQNVEDTVMSVLRGGSKFVANDVLPGEQITDLLQGQSKTGKDAQGRDIYAPITGEQVGEKVGQGILKVLPWAKLLSKIQTGNVRAPLNTRHVISSGEIDAAMAAKEGTLAAAATPEGVLNGAVESIASKEMKPEVAAAQIIADTLTPEEAQSEMFKRGIADVPGFSDAYYKTIHTTLFQDVLKNVKPGTREFQWVSEAIQKGALPEDTARRLAGVAATHELPIEQINARAAKIFADSASFAGTELSVLADNATISLGKLAMDAQAGDVNALQTLKLLTAAKEKANGNAPTTYWSKFVNFANNKVERTRRSLMVGQLATATRNAISQGATDMVGAFEAGISGTVEALVGKTMGDGRTMGDYYGDLIGHYHGIVSRLTPEGRSGLEEVLNATPLVKRKLESGSTFDTGATVLGDALKGALPEGAGQWTQLVGDVLNLPNRLQEMEFRRIAYRARLEGNARALGYEDLNGVMEALRKPEFDPKLKEAVAEAEDYALKQTYAYTPEAGLPKAILNFYKAIPFSTAILPPFPRFMINQYRWQMERSPTLFFNMFEKSFRDDLFSGADNAWKSRQAARQLGQATSGLVMMNAAWILRNSEIAGPKYYQIATTKNAQGIQEFDDQRAYQPFTSYLFLAEAVKSIQTNQPLNMDANEMMDALVGIRRIGEVPAFALADIMRSLNSSDPAVVERAIKTPAGQYFSSFFTPLNTLKDMGAAAGVDDWGIMKDVKGQELTGPAQANIPGSNLPQRMDFTTGTPIASEHPVLRQLLGRSRSAMNDMRQLIASTPDIMPSKLVGDYKNAEADNLVAKHMGSLLSMPSKEGSSMGDMLASKIKGMNLSPVMQKQAIEEMFKGLREAAVARAQQENPRVFVEHMISNLPTPIQEAARKLARNKGLL